MSDGPVSSMRHCRSTVPLSEATKAGASVPCVRPVVQAIVTMLHMDPTLTGDQLSTVLGRSGGRLSRLFKRDMGISIVAFRNRLRFERFFARMASVTPNRPTLRRAARDAGFGSYAHFHRLFRAWWRTSPREAISSAVGNPNWPAVSARVGGMLERNGHLPLEPVAVWLDCGDQRLLARLGGHSFRKIGAA